jgi:hypothetical protein
MPVAMAKGPFSMCLWVGAMALAACSPDVDTVFGRPIDNTDDGGGGSGAGSMTTSTADGGATTVSNGGSPTTTTTDSTNDTSTDTTDVTTDATTDGMETVTTTGRPTGPTVDCGVADQGGTVPECEIEGDGSCCWNRANNGFDCVGSAGECPVGFTNELVAIQCQTDEQCGPDLTCCAHREYVSGQAPYDRTSCEASCSYPNLHTCDIQAPDCPEYNNGGTIIQSVCKQSTLLPAGYYVCGFNN